MMLLSLFPWLTEQLGEGTMDVVGAAAAAELEQQRAKVADAVRVLNHDAQSCNRVAANQWLVQFQLSDAAWEVATSLLLSSPPPLSPGPSTSGLLSPTSSSAAAAASSLNFPAQLGFEVEFFAAQILRRKVTALWQWWRKSNPLWHVSLSFLFRFALAPPVSCHGWIWCRQQIQNEGYYLQLGAKDALINALLLAAKRFSAGPHQVLRLP